MSTSFRIARLFGFDIRMHWSFPIGVFLFLWIWQPQTFRDLLFALVLILLLFFSVTLHELGHALAARAVHVPTKSIVLWPLGGVVFLEKGILPAWQDIFIILAGPVTNVLLAGVAWMALGVWNVLPDLFSFGYNSDLGYFQLAGDTFVYINLALAIFNLIPAYPLDGGQVLRRLLQSMLGERRTAWVMLPLSGLLVFAMLVLGIMRRDPGLMISALFIGVGALTLSDEINHRLNTFAARFYDRGYGYLQAGDPARAVAHYNQAIRRKPHNAMFYNNRGYGYALQRNYIQAIADYKRALERDPKLVIAHVNSIRVYCLLHAFESALHHCQKLIEFQPTDLRGYLLSCSTYIAMHDYDRALEAAEQAERIAPQDSNVLLSRGLIYFLRSPAGHPDQQRAMQEYEKILHREPDNVLAYNNRGYARFINGDVVGAQHDYAQGLDRTTKNSHLYSGRGEIHEANNRDAAAIADYERALALNPLLVFPHVHRAFIAFRSGNIEHSVEHLKHAFATDARSALVLSPNELSFYAKNALAWRLFMCSAAEQQGITPALLGLSRGDAYRVNEQYREALEAYRVATDDTQTRDAALFGSGVSHMALGQTELAKVDLTLLCESDNRFLQRQAREILDTIR